MLYEVDWAEDGTYRPGEFNSPEKFFNDLTGQVFIFSTNEEIVGKHLEIIKDNIQATFLLENTENEKTTVCTNSYFGG